MKLTPLKLLLPLLLCLIVFPLQTMQKFGYQPPILDARGYIHQAEAFAVIPSEEVKAQGIVFAPLYPAFLRGMMELDEEIRTSLHCFGIDRTDCDLEVLAPIYMVQMGLLAVSIFFVFLALYYLSGEYWLSFFAMGLVLGLGKLNVYGTWLITETFAFSFFFAFMAMYTYVLTRPARAVHFVLMGVALAGATLTRPSYMYLFYAMVPLLPLYYLIVKQDTLWDVIKKTVPFFLAFGLVTGPWIFRNYYYYDSASVSAGYGAFILAQRVAYNLMTWMEWSASFFYWMPDFGDKLVASLFSEENYRRLKFDTEDGFYLYGNNVFRQEVFAMAATEEGRMSILMNQYVLGDWFKHVMVTLAMVTRGMWTAKYFGLVGFVALIPAIYMLRHRIHWGTMLAFAFPLYFMLGLNAFVSVSIPRYNMPLLMFYALAVATVVFYLSSKTWRRKIKGRY